MPTVESCRDLARASSSTCARAVRDREGVVRRVRTMLSLASVAPHHVTLEMLLSGTISSYLVQSGKVQQVPKALMQGISTHCASSWLHGSR